MLLAAAAQQKFLGLWVAEEAQGLVFLENPVDRVAHPVLILARLGLDSEGDGGLWEFDRGILEGGPFVGQGVTGQRILQLGYGADIAGMQVRYRGQRLSQGARNVREALGAA